MPDLNQNTNKLLSTLTAQGAGTVDSGDIDNPGCVGLVLTIDITVAGGTPTVDVTILGKDPYSGKYYTILASAQLVAVGTVKLRVYPGLIPAANLVANDVMPRIFKVTTLVGGSTPAITAKIAAALIC